MNTKSIVLAVIVVGIGGFSRAGEPPTRAEIEQLMGLRSEGDLVRGQMDTVGYGAVAFTIGP